jgi:hypothetical protein
VVRFYNGRGAAEQSIKEGKNAIQWTNCRSERVPATPKWEILVEESP